MIVPLREVWFEDYGPVWFDIGIMKDDKSVQCDFYVNTVSHILSLDAGLVDTAQRNDTQVVSTKLGDLQLHYYPLYTMLSLEDGRRLWYFLLEMGFEPLENNECYLT